MKSNFEEIKELKEEKNLSKSLRKNQRINSSPKILKFTQVNNFERNKIWKEKIFQYSDDLRYKKCHKCLLIYLKNGIHKCSTDKFVDSFKYTIENNITLSLKMKKENFTKLKKQEISKSVKRYNIGIIFKKNINI